MLGSVVLDVAIGMAFVYLLLSLIASVAQEILAAFLQLRAANLVNGMRSLFSGESLWGKDLTEAVYTHGLVRGLYADPQLDLRVQGALRAARTAKADADAAARLFELAKNAFEDVKKTVEANPADPVAALKLEEQKAAADAARQKAADAAQLAEARQSQVEWMQPPESLYARLVAPLRRFLQQRVGMRQKVVINGVSDQSLLPAYIPSRTFALAMIDLLNSEGVEAKNALAAIAKKLNDEHTRDPENMAVEAIQTLVVNAKDLDAFQRNLENWYNDAMDRVSGWYKRYTQRILFIFGLLLAVTFNVDSVRVATTLWSDRDTRQAMVTAAANYMSTHQPPAAPSAAGKGSAPAAVEHTGSPIPDPTTAACSTQLGQRAAARADKNQAEATPDTSQEGTVATTPATAAGLQEQLCDMVAAFDKVTKSALLPVGWSRPTTEYWSNFYVATHKERWTAAWFASLLGDTWVALYSSLGIMAGWLLTGMAISLGAPFWFDTLNKFMVVRSTIKPQEKSQIEQSKDN
jgi:hypothetical protein